MSYNSRKGTCFNFQKGTCKFGDNCRYLHEGGGGDRNNSGGGDRNSYGGDRNSGGGRQFQNRQSYDGNDNNRSSSGGGNYSGEKRRYSDHGGGDNRDRNSYSGRGGRGGGGSAYQQKPRKPASMIEHIEPVLDPAVLMAKELLIKLGDMTDETWTNEEDVAAVIPALATAFVDSRDLTTFAEEISDVFADCLSLLPVQTPLIATVLALVAKSNSGNSITTAAMMTSTDGNDTDMNENALPAPQQPQPQEGYVFASRVVEKLTQKFITALNELDILMCKIILRAFSSLVCCKTLAIRNTTTNTTDSYIALLDVLLTVAYAGWNTVSNGYVHGNGNTSALTPSGQIATYLLATTLPWSLHTLLESGSAVGGSVVDRAHALLARVTAEYRSPYSTGGKLAIFHLDTAAATAEERGSGGGEMDHDESGLMNRLNLGPVGVMCWDTLYEASQCTLELIISTSSSSSSNNTMKQQQQSVSSVTLPVPLPECMLTPWTKLQDVFTSADIANFNNTGSNGGDNTNATGDSYSRGSNIIVFKAEFIENVKNSFTLLSTTATVTDGSYANSNNSSNSQWLRPCFSIFDSNSSQPARALAESITHLEKTIVMEYYRDILHFFNPIMREDGTREGQLETLCNHLLSISKFFPNIQHVEYILVETLLILLTQLPLDSVHYSCCCRVLLELCKTHHTIRPILALGVSIVFQYGSEMDTSVWRSLAQWLTFHLVNTKLSWPYWQHWSSEFKKQLTFFHTVNSHTTNSMIEMNSSSSSGAEGENEEEYSGDNYEGLLFIRLVLDKCTRAMVRDQVLSALPADLHILVPIHSPPQCMLLTHDQNVGLPSESESIPTDVRVSSTPHDDATADKAAMATKEGVTVKVTSEQTYCRQLFDMLESRPECDVIENWVDELEEILSPEALEDTHPHWRLRVLTQALFAVGGREAANVSVLQSLLDRYSSALRMFADSPDAQHALLGFMSEVYANSQDGAAFNMTLDLFLRKGILTADVVCTHLTQPQSLGTLADDVWLYTHLETVTDRAVDVVRACVQLYTSLTSKYGYISGGNMVTSADAGLINAGGGDSRNNGDDDDDNIATIGGSGNANIDNDDDDDDDDDGGNRRRFKRTSNDNVTTLTSPPVASVTGGDDGMMVNDNMMTITDESSSTNPITAAYDALLSAITTCRAVYKTLIGSLLTQIALYHPHYTQQSHSHSDSSNSEEVELKIAAFQLAGVSLMMRVLRTIHPVQIEFITPTLIHSLLNTASTQAVTLQETDITLTDVTGIETQLRLVENQLSSDSTSNQIFMYRHASGVAWRSFLNPV